MFLPEDGAETFCGGFNLPELKSEVADIRNYTYFLLTRAHSQHNDIPDLSHFRFHHPVLPLLTWMGSGGGSEGGA